MLQSDYGAISARTEPGATCNARAVLPNGNDAAGIQNPQTADANGNLHWNYPQTPTQTGNGNSIVTCSHGGLSGTAEARFQVGA
jgi:hypothetical protein